tara:strand:+ start:1450 stop:1860 length:411 start_codon:yes stop_codon:yes gene_type:complete
MPSVFNEMFTSSEAENAIAEFVNKNFQDYAPVVTSENQSMARLEGDDYTFAFIEVYGRAAIIPIPVSAARLAQLPPDKKEVSCNCRGDGECKLEKNAMFGYGVYYCKANPCSSCSLSSGGRIGGTIKAERALSFKF